jgi:large subunit GTPase 1
MHRTTSIRLVVTEKQRIRVIQSPSIGLSSAHNPFLLTSQQEKETLQRHQTNKDRLRVPRRPPWTKSLTPAQLDRQERDAFLDWRRSLAVLSEKENLLLTPFERNIEVWRQLWRVLERSHLVVQIVDARNPLRFRCEDLERCIREIEGPEGEKGSGPGRRKPLLLVNKADLLTQEQRKLWAVYFENEGIDFAFYSAATATAIQQREAETLPVAELEAEELKGLKERCQAEEPLDRSEDQRATASDGHDSHDNSDMSDEDSDDMQDGSSSEEGSRAVWLDDTEIHQDQDPSTRVLTVGELEELFEKSAPNLDGTPLSFKLLMWMSDCRGRL